VSHKNVPLIFIYTVTFANLDRFFNNSLTVTFTEKLWKSWKLGIVSHLTSNLLILILILIERNERTNVQGEKRKVSSSRAPASNCNSPAVIEM